MKKIAVSLLSAFLLAAAGFFAWTNSARAKSPDSVVISEALINGSDGKEFIELYNPTGDIIDMSNWVFAYYSKTRDWYSPYRKKFFPADSVLGPSEFFLISVKKEDYPEESNWNLEYSSYQLSNADGAIGIFSDENFSEKNAVDVLGWGEAKVRLFEGIPAPSGKSLEKIDPSGNNEKENWRESCEDNGTPGGEPPEEPCVEEIPSDDSLNDSSENKNSDDLETDGNVSNIGNIYLNEIMPNPKDNPNDEYIEIASGENKPVDLFGWRLKDGSKSKGYQFKEHIVLNSGEHFAIYRSDSKITLNNSDESVYLYNPKGEVVSSAAFDKSQKDASYNFDGEKWKWSKYLTPGKKNKFDSEPSVKVKKIKRAYRDIFVKFSAAAKDKETKNLKYAWDFGDGKKSYLKKTSHKYLDTGKYTVTLSVSDDSQTVEKSFALTVKNYPRPNLKIVKIVPNPAGNDSEGEIIEIKNNSGKKVSLDGWKIATGSGENSYNHPISDRIALNSGETKAVTREMCKFSLNNKAGKVQLVMPDGKVTDVVEYRKEKIADDEAYVKTDGEWKWLNPFNQKEDIEENESDISEEVDGVTNESVESSENGEVLGLADEKNTYYTAVKTLYTPEDEILFFNGFGLLGDIATEKNYCFFNQPYSHLAYLLISDF